MKKLKLLNACNHNNEIDQYNEVLKLYFDKDARFHSVLITGWSQFYSIIYYTGKYTKYSYSDALGVYKTEDISYDDYEKLSEDDQMSYCGQTKRVEIDDLNNFIKHHNEKVEIENSLTPTVTISKKKNKI